MWLIDKMWDDKRICCAVLMSFLVVVLISFQSIDLFHSNFMQFGPNENVQILSVKINNWHSWSMVAFASFCSTLCNDFFSDSISPWICNTIQDHKTHYIPFSKIQCYLVLQVIL